MPCIEPERALNFGWLALLLLLAAGCVQQPKAPAPPTAPAMRPGAAPTVPAVPPSAEPAPRPAPLEPALHHPVLPGTAAAPPPAVSARTPHYVQLGAPSTPRNAAELRLQFARRLVAAHPDTSYLGRAPDRLLAIPVLEVELNADGSVRKIEVLRKPSTGNEATVLAMDAVRRAAPYGDVSRLAKPWKVIETFLFDDELRFKPRTLDQN